MEKWPSIAPPEGKEVRVPYRSSLEGLFSRYLEELGRHAPM